MEMCIQREGKVFWQNETGMSHPYGWMLDLASNRSIAITHSQTTHCSAKNEFQKIINERLQTENLVHQCTDVLLNTCNPVSVS